MAAAASPARLVAGAARAGAGGVRAGRWFRPRRRRGDIGGTDAGRAGRPPAVAVPQDRRCRRELRPRRLFGDPRGLQQGDDRGHVSERCRAAFGTAEHDSALEGRDGRRRERRRLVVIGLARRESALPCHGPGPTDERARRRRTPRAAKPGAQLRGQPGAWPGSPKNSTGTSATPSRSSSCGSPGSAARADSR